MYENRFDKFKSELRVAMPQLLSEIMSSHNGKVYAIAFVTTDDFYGMYVAFETVENYENTPTGRKNAYRRWSCNEWGYSDKELPTDFNHALYENMVQVVDSYDEPNLMNPSPEKWAFAQAFIQSLGDALESVPDSIFETHDYSRHDIVFYTTMSDGDYMREMMKESVMQYNCAPTITKELLDYIK